MHAEQRRFPGPVLAGALGYRPDAGDVQADALKEQQRDQQIGLVSEHQALDAPARPRPAAGERQHGDHDVGVGILGVRVGMVAIVLARPPSAAEPDGQVAAQHAENVVGTVRLEDLPVPGIMAEEAQLAEDHRQEHGGSQLPPRVPDNGERGPAGRECQRGEPDLPEIVVRSPIQQASLPHPPR